MVTTRFTDPLSCCAVLLWLLFSWNHRLTVAHEHSLGCASTHSHEQDDDDDMAFTNVWKEQHRKLQQGVSLAFTIPVCFHVIRPSNDSSANATFLDAAHLQLQLDALNRGFSDASCCDAVDQPWCAALTTDGCSPGTGFTFEMAQVDASGAWDFAAPTNPSTTLGSPCITRTLEDAIYNAPLDSIIMKQRQHELRRGDATVLNVYYTDILDMFGTPRVVGGRAQFPFEYSLKPKLDGVFVSELTVIPMNETEELPTTFHTLIHETGHWLGVYHPFDVTSGCSSDADFVGDTPIQKGPSFGTSATNCNAQRDTCPNESGMDSVHNYMDYSHEVCSFHFTPGQRFRMEAFMVVVRIPLVERPLMNVTVTQSSPETIMVATPIDLGPYDAQYYLLQLDQPSLVYCSDTGVSSLRMRKGARPDLSYDLYDCTTATREATDRCTLHYAEGDVYAVARAGGSGSEGFSLRCVAIPWEDTVESLTLGVPQQVVILATQEVALFRLADLPQESVVSCAVQQKDTVTMMIDFDYQMDVLKQVTPVEQCNTDGSRCTQVVPPGAMAMNVALTPLSTGAVNLTLTCTATPNVPIIELEESIPSNASDLAIYGLQFYEFEVGRNGTEVQCMASSASGEGRLFLNWGSPPQNSDIFECRTESLENPCTASYFGIGGLYYPVTKLYACVEAASAIEDLEVVCSKIEKSIESIEDATAVGPMFLQDRKDAIFELKVSPGVVIDCRCDARARSDGELDMYLQLDEPFDVTLKANANCSAETSLSQESCSLKIPENSTSSSLFITLLPFDGDVEGATLFCTVSSSASEPDPILPTSAPVAEVVSVPGVPLSFSPTVSPQSAATGNDNTKKVTSAATLTTLTVVACHALTLAMLGRWFLS